VFGPSPDEWVDTFLCAQRSAETYVQDDKVTVFSDVLLAGSTSWIKSLNQISEEPKRNIEELDERVVTEVQGGPAETSGSELSTSKWIERSNLEGNLEFEGTRALNDLKLTVGTLISIPRDGYVTVGMVISESVSVLELLGSKCGGLVSTGVSTDRYRLTMADNAKDILEQISSLEKMDSSMLCQDNDRIRDKKIPTTRRFGSTRIQDIRGHEVCNKVLNLSNFEKSLNPNPRCEGTHVPQQWVVIINPNRIVKRKDTLNPAYQCMIGMTHLMDNLKDNIWHSQVVRKDAQVLSRKTVMRLGVITSQNIRRHTAWDITICIDNIEVSVMKHAETEGTQNSSWQPSHITFARSEDTHKPLQRPSNLLARTGNTGLLDTHCPEARTKNKVIKSLQNVGIEGTQYPRGRQLNLQAHIENISVPLMLKTESKIKK